MKTLILSLFLLLTPLCAYSTSDEVLNQLLLKEMNDWLNDYDEKGILKKDLFKVDPETSIQIRKNSVSANKELFHKSYQEILSQKKWLEESLLNFRQTQFEFSQMLKKEEYDFLNQKTQMIDVHTKKIKSIYEKSYQEMIQLGQNLRKVLDKENQ